MDDEDEFYDDDGGLSVGWCECDTPMPDDDHPSVCLVCNYAIHINDNV